MRLVLDTNTVVSSLFWKGSPYQLLSVVRARRDIVLYSSPALLAELAGVLTRRKFVQAFSSHNLSPEALISRYVGLVRVVKPVSVPAVLIADPDDDHVLACALAARADLIVSGDADLLDLGAYQDIAIVAAAEALRRIARP